MSARFNQMMSLAADLLEQAGQLGRLTISLTPRHSRMVIETPAFETIGAHRQTIDALAAVVGVTASLKTTPVSRYSAEAHQDGVHVMILATAPPASFAQGTEATRSTSASEIVELLRSLAPWADSLDPALAHTLTILDHGTHLAPMLHVDGAKDRAGAAGKAVANLPTQIDVRWFGSEGRGMLPTGHTLTITTL